MADWHQPQKGDKFWDGSIEPQPNGRIIAVHWQAGDGDYDSKEVVVEYYDSYHRRAYTFGEIKHSYDHKYKLYRLNVSDREHGFDLTNGIDHNDPKQRGY